VGKVMHRRKEWPSPHCSICFRVSEDRDHVLQCGSSMAKRKWKELVSEFLISLEGLYTEDYIQDIFKNRLISWPRSTFHKFKRERMPRATRIAMEAQDILGWKSFIYGRMSEEWEVAQQAWLDMAPSKWRGNGKGWSAKVVGLLFNLVYSMWENRNNILHGPDHRWKLNKRRMWDSSIRLFFDKTEETDWKPEDRRLFSKGVRTVLGYSDEAKQQWLESIRQANRRRCNPLEDNSAVVEGETSQST